MSVRMSEETFANAAHGFTFGEVADKIRICTGKDPVAIRCQALLVLSTFEDETTVVHRIEDLMAL